MVAVLYISGKIPFSKELFIIRAKGMESESLTLRIRQTGKTLRLDLLNFSFPRIRQISSGVTGLMKKDES